jgi:flagellin
MSGSIEKSANSVARSIEGRKNVRMGEIATGKRKLGGAESAVASKLTSTTRSLAAATSNAQRALSFGQIADGALSKLAEEVIRIKELAVAASSDTFDATDRAKAQAEVATRLSTVDDVIVGTTRFGDSKLLDGTGGTASDGKFKFQIAEKAGDEIELDLSAKFDATTLGVNIVDVSTYDNAQTAIGLCDTALGLINDGRAAAGAFLAGIESTISVNQVKAENLEGALSVLEEVDFGDAMPEVAALNFQSQAAQAMISKGMENRQNLLGLLR